MRNTRKESCKCANSKRQPQPSQCLLVEWGGPADVQKQVTEKYDEGSLSLHSCRMAVEDHVTSGRRLLPALTLCLARVHLPPLTFSPSFWTQSLTLHKTTMLKSAGPDLPDEIAHSQSHGHTVEINTGKRGWRMGFVKWNKGQTPVNSYQHSIGTHNLYTVG